MLEWLAKRFSTHPPDPPAESMHREFGLLLGEEGLWSGTACQHGREIRFTIAGTGAGPDPRLLDRLPRILSDFSRLESSARELLCPPDASLSAAPGDFTFRSVDLLWPDEPDCFTFEFALDGDEGAIWRVEFHQGQPKYTGRDS